MKLLFSLLLTGCCGCGVDFYPCLIHTPIKSATGDIQPCESINIGNKDVVKMRRLKEQGLCLVKVSK